MVFQDSTYKGMFLTGSADARIKLWVRDFQNRKSSYICCQTLVDHRGTILALAMTGQLNIIASSSTDQSIRLWKQQPGRELMLYPFYLCMQVLDYTYAPTRDIGGKGIWVTSLLWKEGDDVQLFAGDTEGTIISYKPNED